MDDNTPTDVQPVDNAGTEAPNVEASALPDDNSAQDTAVQSQDTQPEATTQEDSDKLTNWAASQNIDLDNPTAEDAKRLAKVARDNQVAYRKQSQEKSEFERRVSQPELAQQPGEAESVALLREMRAERDAERKLSEFKNSNPDWEQHKDAMSDVLNQTVNTSYGTVTRAQLLDNGLLSLDDVYTLAKGSAGHEQSLKQQGARESLEKLASKQMAEAPRGQAVDHTPQEKEETDPFLDGFDQSY